MTDEHSSTPTDINAYRAQRLENLKKLEALGHVPYGYAFPRTGTLKELRDSFEVDRPVQAAGRLIAHRIMGKIIFAHLQDGSDRFQIYLKKDQLEEEVFQSFSLLDLGDHLGVEGVLFLTKTGEPTIHVKRWVLLSKALLPLPDKWAGLHDVEARYRQRYLDLISNPESRKVFDQRVAILRYVREFLQGRGYHEVETPMMQPQPGGAAATPFKTRYNALNCDMYMRIAPELYLKRLLVGGFDKVFELNRNFRNEGISRQHNPEFTMVEIYEAYGDMNTMAELVQSLITGAAEGVIGSLNVGTEEQPVDLSSWRRVTYNELIEEKAGADYFTRDRAGMAARAQELGCHVESDWDETTITQEIFEKLIERTLINPTFVTRLPAALVPLAKGCPDDPRYVDVFELIIGGREIAPGYTELNDPVVQRERLEAQVGEDAQKVDEPFLEALEHGMPPAGGMGIGIDRLVMLLTGAESIRDVILFPQLKPRD